MTATLAEEIATRVPTTARTPVGVLMSRFPTVTETFILREMIEMERQSQSVRLVPMLKESPPVIHDAARPWTARALYTPYINVPIAAANLRALARHPVRYISLFAKLVAGTALRPGTLARTIALYPKSVYLAEKLRQEGIRHIHAHFATHPTTMALIIAAFSNITFSFTVHAHDIQLDHSLLRWKLREAKFIRSISDFNRRYLERLYPSETGGKITVVHVGIEPEMYERSSSPASSASQAVPRLLCVAAHRPYKGLPVLIEACARLRDEGVHFACDIVGQGPMYNELVALIRKRGLESLVHLLGPRSQDDVAAMMRDAALFVLPSIITPDGQMEGIPVALMEAMASGKPVVSTSISGIPELIDDGENGFLVPPGDAAALARAIRRVLDQPSAEMGARAREKIRRAFALRDCVTQLLTLLDAEASR